MATDTASARGRDGTTNRTSADRGDPAATPEGAATHGRAPTIEVPGRLFDGTGKDRDVTVTPELIRDLDDRQTLWIDLDDPGDEQVQAIADLFDLHHDSLAALRSSEGRPSITMWESYIHLQINAVETDDDGERTVGVGMIAGPNFLVTLHTEPVDFLVSFQDHLKGDTMIGHADAPSFLAALLDWWLTGYFRVVDALERDADRLDLLALHPQSEKDLLADLVHLRRRISAVRRDLTPHREVFAALTRPELTGLGKTDAADHFRGLVDRLERAIDSVEVARELVIGSFDVHMTRTAQRTNEVMKVLTLATVILLPGSMIAGIMGMNFKVSLFDEPTGFWIVLVVVAAVAGATLMVARVRRWI